MGGDVVYARCARRQLPDPNAPMTFGVGVPDTWVDGTPVRPARAETIVVDELGVSRRHAAALPRDGGVGACRLRRDAGRERRRDPRGADRFGGRVSRFVRPLGHLLYGEFSRGRGDRRPDHQFRPRYRDGPHRFGLVGREETLPSRFGTPCGSSPMRPIRPTSGSKELSGRCSRPTAACPASPIPFP